MMFLFLMLVHSVHQGELHNDGVEHLIILF